MTIPTPTRPRKPCRTRPAGLFNTENIATANVATIVIISGARHPRLWRAYLLNEGLRHVFKVKGEPGKQALQRWCSWAQRCRIPAFTDLARKIKRNRAQIHASLEHHLSNALIESMNTKIRLLTRTAYGFANPHALIALALLAHGGHRPHLPGRTHT
ncbi:MAG TPA: transposase [Actinocrinis sp.]|nr:transposase [Actinocrinis sp.]